MARRAGLTDFRPAPHSGTTTSADLLVGEPEDAGRGSRRGRLDEQTLAGELRADGGGLVVGDGDDPTAGAAYGGEDLRAAAGAAMAMPSAAVPSFATGATSSRPAAKAPSDRRARLGLHGDDPAAVEQLELAQRALRAEDERPVAGREHEHARHHRFRRRQLGDDIASSPPRTTGCTRGCA